MTLTQIAFLLFAAIAAGGLLMVGMIFKKMQIPSFLGAMHGLGGLAASAVLLVANLTADATPERAWWALGVFVAGLAGGFLFFRVLFPRAAPMLLVAGHGSIAAIGLYLLYGVAF